MSSVKILGCGKTKNSFVRLLNLLKQLQNYEKHNYIYFCAKEDFSGYHNFASNLAQHQVNARKFQQALTKRRIMK